MLRRQWEGEAFRHSKVEAVPRHRAASFEGATALKILGTSFLPMSPSGVRGSACFFHCLVVELFRGLQPWSWGEKSQSLSFSVSTHPLLPLLLSPSFPSFSRGHLPRRRARERQCPYWWHCDGIKEFVKSSLSPFILSALHLPGPHQQWPPVHASSVLSLSNLPRRAIFLNVSLLLLGRMINQHPFSNTTTSFRVGQIVFCPMISTVSPPSSGQVCPLHPLPGTSWPYPWKFSTHPVLIHFLSSVEGIPHF